jgi:hypothetical protein
VHDAAPDVGRPSGDDDTGVGKSQIHGSPSRDAASRFTDTR